MARTRLREIKIQSFGSINEATVRFQDRGLVLVKAANKLTGGSSGGGKSTFLSAIAYALDYCSTPGTELQSWNSDKPMRVELALDSEAGPAIISRGAGKTSLKVGDGKPLTAAKSIAEALRSYLGASPDLISTLTFREQQQPGRFLSKTNAEKQEFLSTLLGLKELEAAAKQARENAKALDTEIAVLKSRVATTQAELTRLEGVDVSRFSPQPEALEQARQQLIVARQVQVNLLAEVQTLEEQERALRSEYEQAKVVAETNFRQVVAQLQQVPPEVESPLAKSLQEKLAYAEPRLREMKVAEDARLKAHQLKLQELEANMGTLKVALSQSQRAMADLAKMVTEIETLKKSECSTCHQPWAQAQSRAAALEADYAAKMTSLVSPETIQGQIQALVIEKQGFKFVADPQIANIESLLRQLRGALQEEQMASVGRERARSQAIQAKIEQARAEAGAALEPIGQKHRAVLASLEEAKMRVAGSGVQAQQILVESLTREDAQRQELLAEHLQLLASRREELARLNAQFFDVEKKQKAELDFAALIGREGFLSQIFDETLAQISDITNAILGRIANTAHLTLQFKSEFQTQKGTAVKEIRPVVNVGGREAPYASACSGGMKSVVALAVDLAVRRVIRERTGAYPGWLILDECFEGMDDISKETCMQILSEVAADDLVLVVDHSEGFKELFASTVHLTFNAGVTSISEDL